ncbi:MAG: hypothetical protein C5B51_31850 [Terriglobia bacterium]|nr:MAG: hypothetical protein C5B51_31850 [Terriglobia bacterium]
MIRWRRRQFNSSWTPAQYARFLALLERRFGEPNQFRLSETPIFLPAALVGRMARYGCEMVEQLLANPEYQRASREAIPERYRVPREDPTPLFVQADFGLDENLEPKLVEIQGFPSLYAYQPVLADAYREAFAIDSGLSALPDGLTDATYSAGLREAIVGKHDPETVVLLEIDPWNQKTRHDFTATEQLLGVRAVDVRAVERRGRGLYYDRDGRPTPIRRIYNRVIVDELERRRMAIPFDYRDDMDVEWAGHPNWFFRLSKFSLPYLDHPAAPEARFLHEAGAAARHPEDYVLKPLYSFAGLGVVVGPSAEQIREIPEEQRPNYLLQKRVNFRPVVETPFGPTKIEVRIMYLWQDRLRPVNTILRMGRGAQMGVDHNKAMEWVGASAAFLDPGGDDDLPVPGQL